MTHRVLTYCSVLAFILCQNLSFSQSQLKQGNNPSWIQKQTYSNNPNINLDDVSYGIVTLLMDEQLNSNTQEQYIRSVKKITDNVGVQEGSSLSINFDPTYQTLIIHDISVYRQDKTIDKLRIDDFQLIRKESKAENYIYDGSLDAILNLSDIRRDDIIDISYTIKGFNPIHNGHFSGGILLNSFEPVGKVHAQIVSKTKLNYKTVNTTKPVSIKQDRGLYYYEWSDENVAKANFEMNEPLHDITYANLFFSDYENWNEVAKWGVRLYPAESLSPDLTLKVNEIKNTYSEEGDRIKAALRFVQNEIRYLGLEDGIGAYKPFSPNKVFEQRYGDCKDKTYLLYAILKAMDIEAYPVLINTIYGPNLSAFLPTPRIFDHVTIKVIDSKGASYFYDPTIANQGGRYNSTYFPSYGYGLVIKNDTFELEKIENNSSNLVEFFDTYTLNGIGNDATLSIYTVYHEQGADNMRALFKTNSLSSIKEEFKTYYSNYFQDLEVLEDPTFEDDSIANEFTIYEKYKINNAWEPMIGMDNQIAFTFSPYSINEVFYMPESKNRKKAFELYYPIAREHNITVKLPQRWGLEPMDNSINSKNFYFSLESKMNPSRDILYLKYFYKNQTPLVEVNDMDAYYEDGLKLQNQMAYYIYIDKKYATNTQSFNFNKNSKNERSGSSAPWTIIIISFAIVLAVIIIYVVRAKNV